jgi:hypothetical protein
VKCRPPDFPINVQLVLLYYRGEGVFPAWKEREEAEAYSWRGGNQLRKVWNKLKVAVQLVEDLAAARHISVEEAACAWDQVLAEGKTGQGVASMCRINNRPKLLKLVGL